MGILAVIPAQGSTSAGGATVFVDLAAAGAVTFVWAGETPQARPKKNPKTAKRGINPSSHPERRFFQETNPIEVIF
jgi:hypothetical protein